MSTRRRSSRLSRRGSHGSDQLALTSLSGGATVKEVKLTRDSTRGWLAGYKEGLFQLRLEGSPTENVYIAHVGASDGEDDARNGNLFVRDVVVRIRHRHPGAHRGWPVTALPGTRSGVGRDSTTGALPSLPWRELLVLQSRLNMTFRAAILADARPTG